MRSPDTDYKNNNTLYSKDFDDIYFSVEDGLAESEFVFLKGNDLFDQWPDYQNIKICETGFGTGLNFLAAAKLFKRQAKKGQKLFYTAIEKHPLKPEIIRQSLNHWRDHFPDIFDHYLDQYPMRIHGFHPIMISKDIFLVLIFDDVLDALSQITDRQDYWFLDGFSPAQNPDMWQEDMFKHIKNLSHSQTKLATFTAAGKVKRALETNQFNVKKIDGFGRKREMITAQSINDIERPKPPMTPSSVSIAGAGMAGLSTACLLQNLGIETTIFEKNAAAFSNASSNQWGIINPRIGAARMPAFDYFNAAFSLFNRTHKNRLKQIGAIHIANDKDKQKRFEKFVHDIEWPKEHAFKKDQNIFFPDAGMASPIELCKFYAKGLNIHYGQEAIASEDTMMIYTTSHATNDVLKPSSSLPLQKIRGQVSYADIGKENPLYNLENVISCGSYIAPIRAGKICFGATFKHWDDNSAVTKEDHDYNLEKLAEINPDFAKQVTITDGWADFRCSSKDRLPIIGKHERGFLNIAHGSHGMISSLAGAYIIAYQLGLIPQPFSKTVLEALSPQRYDKE